MTLFASSEARYIVVPFVAVLSWQTPDEALFFSFVFLLAVVAAVGVQKATCLGPDPAGAVYEGHWVSMPVVELIA